MPIKHKQDLISTILVLSKGLQTEHDLPQVVISFQEQSLHDLKFHIILVRSIKSDTDHETLLELSKMLPSRVRFIPERVASVGTLGKASIKEANVFSLEIESNLFLRKNHSVNLMQAKKFVQQALEKMIGPFNDHTICLPPEKTHVKLDEKKRHELRLHLPRAAQSLDPRLGADRTTGLIIKMLYEGLFRINKDNLPEPACAQSVEISEDQTKYLFFLKQSYWSNGSELTAFDFEYAWKKILEPDFRSPYCFLFFPIKNAEAVKRGEKSISHLGINVLDDKTLQVQLEYPAPFFLELTANWLYSPLCREIDQKHPGWAYHSAKTHVCNGPFKLDIWHLDDDLQMIKNLMYWDVPSVKIEKIQISIIEDEKKGAALFDQGELDWIGDPLSKMPPVYLAKLKKEGRLHVDPNHFGLFWLQINLLRLPFQNSKIRKAFAYGTNRQAIIDNHLYTDDIPAFGFSSIDLKRHPNFKDGDHALALSLFEEGLGELGITRQELPPIVISHSEIEEHETISHALGEQWRRLFGVEIKYNRCLWNTYFEALSRNEIHIGGITWYTRFRDPLYYYNLFVFREHAVHISSWKNLAYNRLIEEARHAADTEKQKNYLEKAEKMLLDVIPVIPLFYQRLSYGKNPRLKGAILSTTNQIDFREAYLEEEASNPEK